MEPWFLKWCGVYLASTFAALYIAFSSKIYLPSGRLFQLVVGVFVARIASYALFPGLLSAVNAIDAIALCFLILFFAIVLREKKIVFKDLYWPTFIVVGGISALAAFQYLQYQGPPSDNHTEISSTFGNINMLLEYLVLVLPLVFYFVRSNSGVKRNLFLLVATLLLVCIFIGGSRSALLAVILFLAFCGLRRKFGFEVICFCLAGALFFIVKQTKPSTSEYNALTKTTSTRTELYRGGLQMLKSNPLGVGAEGFDFNYTPYQMNTTSKPTELEHFETPHNEFLKWGIESGWLFLLVQMFFWFFVFVSAWKKDFKNEESFLLKALLFVSLPQMLFQFPFELGASTFFLAFVIGFYFASESLKPLAGSAKLRVAFVIIAVGMFVNLVSYATSTYLDSNFQNDESKLQTACEVYPYNWHACVSLGRMKALSTQPLTSLPILKDELARRSFNWVALKLIAVAYFQVNQKPTACAIGLVYAQIMNNEGEGPKTVAAQCPGQLSPLNYINPVQFETDYKKWLAGITN